MKFSAIMLIICSNLLAILTSRSKLSSYNHFSVFSSCHVLVSDFQSLVRLFILYALIVDRQKLPLQVKLKIVWLTWRAGGNELLKLNKE